MRKVVLFIATSLDGFIARSSGDVDWLFQDQNQDYGYDSLIAGTDTVVMGRRTYEQILTFGDYPYHGMSGYVFSTTRSGERDANVEFVSGDVARFIAGLKAGLNAGPGENSEKNIWLVGGGKLNQAFLEQGLIDEFILSVHPVILGEGIPLFQGKSPSQELSFRHCQSFENGLVQLTYARKS